MSLIDIFARNKEWADSIKAKDDSFFSKSAKQQSPKIVWIGCSDSRAPESVITASMPGEIFVHRNIANMVVYTDISLLSVIQFAVEVLGVSDIVVCGHYECGGIKFAMEDGNLGLIDNWLLNIKDVENKHRSELESLNSEQYFRRLCEVNVMEQVNNLCRTSIVQDAWSKGLEFTVHGIIYDISTGLLKDLNVKSSNNS